MAITFHPDGRVTGNKLQTIAGSGSSGSVIQTVQGEVSSTVTVPT